MCFQQQQQQQHHHQQQYQHQPQQPQQLQQPLAVMYAPAANLQGPVTSTSDNSGSGSFMLNAYGAAGTPAVAANSGLPSPMQQQQQQTAYMLSPTALQPMLLRQQASPGAVAALSLQQQSHMGAAGAALQPHPQLVRSSAEAHMGPMVNLSLQVSSNQMAVISNQLYSIAAVSGADLTTAPVAAGLFHINITGAQNQVGTARQLITSVLSQAM